MDTQTESRTEFIVRHLRAAMPRNWPEIAEKSGVPFKTIQKIAHGTTADPRTSTTERLFAYFDALEKAQYGRRATD